MDDKLQQYYDYKKHYYEGRPLISDVDFDKFEEDLLKKYPNLRDEVIGWKDTTHQKFKHPTPLTSLNKVNFYSHPTLGSVIPKTLINWINTLEDKYLTYSPKYDGSAINIIYKKGKLWKVLSRGDGIEGRDVTKKFPQLPKHIKVIEKTNIVEFRGEALMKLTTFSEKYTNFKNPRNLVAGLLGNKDWENDGDVLIELFEVRFNGIIQHESIIDNCGLKTPHSFPYKVGKYNNSNFIKWYDEMLKWKSTCVYQLDGFVLKQIEKSRSSKVDGNPKDCIAIKFPPSETVSEILNIEWNVGKTGELNPILHLTPALLDGSIVKKASAHNKSYIEEKGFYPTAHVTISKSGDIIPQAREVIIPSNKKYHFITNCPSCGNILEEDGINLYCPNEDCCGQKLKKLNGIKHFGIKFLGNKTLEKLYHDGITQVEHFFTSKFSKEHLMQLGWDDGRLLERMLNEIKSINKVKLEDVIIALQFEGVGKKLSIEYAKKINNLPNEVNSLDKKASQLIDDSRIRNFVSLLQSNNIEVINPTTDNFDEDIINVELSGNVNIKNIKTKQEFLNQFTNIQHNSLNKNTKYLIIDDINSTSSKANKARKLNVELITYEDFYQKYK